MQPNLQCTNVNPVNLDQANVNQTSANQTRPPIVDYAIVGAGMAGLIAARGLQRAGKSVLVIDKSRGLGGRMATRRIGDQHLDHGVCYLTAKSPSFQAWIDDALDRNLLRPWTDQIHHPDLTPEPRQKTRYVAPDGITALAKDLAKDLTIVSNRLITALEPIAEGWQMICNHLPAFCTAKSVILANPAPQALTLLQPLFDRNLLEPELWQQVSSVEYAPCITAIAVYSAEARSKFDALPIQGIQSVPNHPHLDDPILGWIGIEHTKQINPTQGLLILQANGMFSKEHFDAPDLAAIGQQLCDRAAELLQRKLSDVTFVTNPEALQVHRWKYAFPLQFLPHPYLAAQTTPHPLYCIGDWCGGNRLEAAFQSGNALLQRLTPTA